MMVGIESQWHMNGINGYICINQTHVKCLMSFICKLLIKPHTNVFGIRTTYTIYQHYFIRIWWILVRYDVIILIWTFLQQSTTSEVYYWAIYLMTCIWTKVIRESACCFTKWYVSEDKLFLHICTICLKRKTLFGDSLSILEKVLCK